MTTMWVLQRDSRGNMAPTGGRSDQMFEIIGKSNWKGKAEKDLEANWQWRAREAEYLELIRWGLPKGVPHFSQTQELAILEKQRNFHERGLTDQDFANTSWLLTSWNIDLDLAAIPSVDLAVLPSGWEKRLAKDSIATMNAGREWLKNGGVALRVPSVVLPPGAGWNLLVNRAHPDFSPSLIKLNSKESYSWPDYLGMRPVA